MAIALFIGSTLFLGAWYLMRSYVPYDSIEKLYLVLGLKGLSGAFLAIFISSMLAFIVCYNPWFSPPQTPDTVGVISWDDSRIYICIALLLGFNMIGIPIGFLIGMAKANKTEDRKQ
ncbi:hypothetical protein IJT17_03725 [bacterium]|nr:hypothetical protein [bacterium]